MHAQHPQKTPRHKHKQLIVIYRIWYVGLWDQIDALPEQLVVHVGIFQKPKASRLSIISDLPSLRSTYNQQRTPTEDVSWMFNSIGMLKNYEYHIILNDNAKPAHHYGLPKY